MGHIVNFMEKLYRNWWNAQFMCIYWAEGHIRLFNEMAIKINYSMCRGDLYALWHTQGFTIVLCDVNLQTKIDTLS